jgi:hypothetical protein
VIALVSARGDARPTIKVITNWWLNENLPYEGTRFDPIEFYTVVSRPVESPNRSNP